MILNLNYEHYEKKNLLIKYIFPFNADKYLHFQNDVI